VRRMLLCAAVALLAAAPAWAHRVRVFAVAEGGRVLCNGFFASGDPARDCAITVETLDGKRVAQGRTDAEGNAAFQIEEPGDLKIILHAGEGHGADYILKASARQTAAAAPPGAEPASAPTAPAGPAQPAAPAAGDEARLKAVVRAVVQEEMLKLRRALVADLQRGPGFTEIAGGVGFIFGVMGLALYARSRRRQPGD